MLAVLQAGGAVSRADLMRRTGLSRSTVSSLVRHLVEHGLVRESADRGTPHNGRGGRPPTLLELIPSSALVVGVDLGHRHVRVALARLDSQVVEEQAIDHDVDTDPAETLDRVAGLVERLLDAHGSSLADVRGVGMGVPGPVDRAGRMTSGILPAWRGLRPAEALADRIGLLAFIDNDAHMGARGELAYGAASGHRDVLYVKASTGIGAGVIVDGRLVGGATGEAGELGHVQVDENGVMCRCGSRGCLETVVSAGRLLEFLQSTHDDPLTIPKILQLAESGDQGVNRAMADAGRRMGRVLADVCTILNPERIVLGGAIGSVSATLVGIRESIDRYAQPNSAAAVTVVPGALGERAEVLGAVSMAIQASSQYGAALTA